MEPEEKKQLFDKLDNIERGIYGDKANKQEGLLEKVERHDKMLKVYEVLVWHNPKVFFVTIAILVEILLETNKIGIITTLIGIFK